MGHRNSVFHLVRWCQPGGALCLFAVPPRIAPAFENDIAAICLEPYKVGIEMRAAGNASRVFRLISNGCGSRRG